MPGKLHDTPQLAKIVVTCLVPAVLFKLLRVQGQNAVHMQVMPDATGYRAVTAKWQVLVMHAAVPRSPSQGSVC